MKINVILTQYLTSLFSESNTSLFSENDAYLLSGNAKQIRQIYDLLKLKYVPFLRKKSVVLPEKFLKNDSS